MAYTYKYCVVPQCISTSIRTPGKLFVYVPTDPKRRKMWLQLSRRDPNSLASNTSIFMCEDHFDMEKDQANYLKYKMGFNKYIVMKKEAVPTKFQCQEDRKRQNPSPSGAVFPKRQRTDLITECLQEEQEVIQPEELPRMQEKETSTDPIITTDKFVQVRKANNKHFRSKAVQTKWEYRTVSTSPLKATTTSSFTSPFKIEPYYPQLPKKRMVKATRRRLILEDEKSDSDRSFIESGHLSPFITTSSSKVTESESEVTDTAENIKKLQALKSMMYAIQKKPLLYIGIPKDCYFLIQLLHKHTNIKEEHIMLCLKKIRLNTTFSELEDNFGISLSYSSKIFLENIPILSSFLRPFIVNLNKKIIKKNLPIAFRHNYHNVSCIIDCLEIDIQKPSKALYQALTWSEYKKGNTVKYLVSCTPNGLVNYISQGFGGRTSDVTLVENCDFVDTLPPGTVILADRGFKHLEQLLHAKGMKLLRPPSVHAGLKLSKTEVRQTKIIASLRIHIERVIRRIREFHMLKQHSVVNNNMLRILDHIIIIACALINLQDSLIK